MSDLGSIKEISCEFYNVRHYFIKSADLDKLKLIDNAEDGSTAWCTDTHELYVLHLGEWTKQF